MGCSMMKTTKFYAERLLPPSRSLRAAALLYSPLDLHLGVKGPSSGNVESKKPEISTSLRHLQCSVLSFRHSIFRRPKQPPSGNEPSSSPTQLESLFGLSLGLR